VERLDGVPRDHPNGYSQKGVILSVAAALDLRPGCCPAATEGSMTSVATPLADLRTRYWILQAPPEFTANSGMDQRRLQDDVLLHDRVEDGISRELPVCFAFCLFWQMRIATRA
jgi:hypothetical protein